MTTKKDDVKLFLLQEHMFWRGLNAETINKITLRGQLNREEMFLYGEFGFALLGLKPAVLVDFCDKRVNEYYLECVIIPTLDRIKDHTLKYHVIKNVETPESNLDGCILIYSTKNMPQILSDIISNQDQEKFVSEESMALLLNYPGHLPRSEEEIPTMLSVMYFHERPNGDQVLLTTFAIQLNEKEQTMMHFERYYEECLEVLDIKLKLVIK